MSQKQIHLLSPLFLAIWLLGLGSIRQYHSSLWTSLWAQFNSLSSKFPHFSKVMTGDSDVQNFKMAKDECSLTRWALWKWGWGVRGLKSLLLWSSCLNQGSFPWIGWGLRIYVQKHSNHIHCIHQPSNIPCFSDILMDWGRHLLSVKLKVFVMYKSSLGENHAVGPHPPHWPPSPICVLFLLHCMLLLPTSRAQSKLPTIESKSLHAHPLYSNPNYVQGLLLIQAKILVDANCSSGSEELIICWIQGLEG